MFLAIVEVLILFAVVFEAIISYKTYRLQLKQETKGELQTVTERKA